MQSRAQLRIADLKQRTTTPTRLLNVQLPTQLGDAISKLARALGASQTEVVIALLNSGLELAQKQRKKRVT